MEKEIDKKEYEISFLVKNHESEGAVETLVKQHGANVVFKSPVSETRLAYPIKKFQQAYFGYMYFAAMPAQVEKIVHDANLSPTILRVLVITPPIGKGRASLRNNQSERTGKKPVEIVAPAVVGGILTNEALEEKLEEILK